MSDCYRAVKVSDRVYWVGAIDWDMRDFHGYATRRGTTYNAYLVLGEKIALIDTVKAPFVAELLARISSVVDPRRIDYLISNHAEMDHSGGIPAVIEAAKPEKVLASTLGVKALAEHFELKQEVEAVKDGETVSLGNLTLAFVETRMLHWPESMMTYLVEEQTLFSNDAFGMHLASSGRFDDELPEAVLEEEAARYYANILLPLSPLVSKLLDKVGKLGIEIKTIAPSHGPIWRKAPQEAVARYAKWAAGKRTDKALVVYDTMWHSTEKMARAIEEGLTEGGVEVKTMALRETHRSDVAAEVLDAGALLVGCPTLNGGLLPRVADVLSYLKGLKPRGMIGAAFGSYGWGGEAVGQVAEILSAMKVELVGDGMKVKYVPDGEALSQCFALGREVAEELKKRV